MTIKKLICLVIFGLLLMGCSSTSVELDATATTQNTVLPTETRTPLPTATNTAIPSQIPTPIPTLPPEQADKLLKELLWNNPDCSAPCFWGVTPEKTTFSEAVNIFASLGLQLEKTNTENTQEFYATNYHIESELEVTIILTVQDNTIKALGAGMNIYTETGRPRKWSAYSPENLIQRYGSPSKVDFFLGRVTPTPTHSMVLYFDDVDLIVSYSGVNFLNNKNTLELCPLINEVNFMKIWMGKEPRHPPPVGVSLEQATSLRMDGFSKLLTGDPNKACFNLKDEAFP